MYSADITIKCKKSMSYFMKSKLNSHILKRVKSDFFIR